MQKPRSLHSLALAAALAATLALAPAPSRASSDPGDDPDGLNNLISYSLCAAGVAVSVVSNPKMLVGALIYCFQLYRTAD
jgi:hypothetical protein